MFDFQVFGMGIFLEQLAYKINYINIQVRIEETY